MSPNENPLPFILFGIVVYGLLFLSLFSHADDLIIRGGPGIIEGSTSGESKLFSVRSEDKAFLGIYTSQEVGFWTDNRVNANSAGYVKMQLGVKPGAKEGVFAKAFVGPALISNKDNILGGHFQFSEDIGFGIRDKDTSVCITYTHFSSAGISKPNKGRDYLLFDIGWRW